MPKQTIYTVGGTVQAGGGVYIKRKADDELLELCRRGEFAFILSSRQVGKSSLMVRTARQLEQENICSVTIDLSAIGVKVSPDEWYLGIMNEIHSALDLKTDLFAWWNQYAQLGPAQRLANFFKDILLKEVQEQIVLFFDEIDSTLSIPFSDDFYVAIRAVYNARSTNPDFKRLSFVLVGVATPADLISDNKRTPFNIGRRVEINDFTLAEALPLAEGLGQQAVEVLTWVFEYTGGHPYLTQRLCAYLANSKASPNEQTVKNAVDRLFTGEQGKQDNNLQFVRDMLSARSPDVTRVLKTYKDIRAGKKVTDDERSLTKSHLKLSGLVRSEKGVLRVRNEIYNSVFDLQWVRENTPKNWQKVALISLSASLGILMLATLAIFINDFFVGTRVNESIAKFIYTTSSEERLASLAQIYSQKGILSNTDSSLQAAQLFYGLSSAEDQLALFRAYGIEQNPALQNDIVTVISHLYVTVANVETEIDNTILLQTMLDSISHIPDDAAATTIKDELTAWIAARTHVRNGNYEAALASYQEALSLNPSNHATLYERAKVYIALERFADALNDLDAAISAAEQAAPVVAATATPTASLTLGSETLTPAPAQTRETGSTPSQSTSVSSDGETPVGQSTPAATPTVLATSTPPSSDVRTVERYESKFTTLIDVINAVRTLIETTPELQLAAQQNGESSYTNLQSFGLVRDLPTQAPTQESSLSPAVSETASTDLVAAAQPTSPTTPQNNASCTVLQDLNLRSGPGTAYSPPLAPLQAGTEFVPIGFDPEGVPGGSWVQAQVESINQTGWVSAGEQFISCDIEFASLPIVEIPPPPAISGDWANGCISELWVPYPAMQTTEFSGCLAEPIHYFFANDGRLTFLVNDRFEDTQVFGMFAPLPTNGTASIDVFLRTLQEGEIWIGVFAEPDINSQGMIIVIPAGDVTNRSLVQKTMPGQIEVQQTAFFAEKSATYGVVFEFGNGSVESTIMRDTVFNLLPVDSTQQWLFVGFQLKQGSNQIDAEFLNLVIQSK